MLSYSYNIKGETNVMEKKSNHFSGQLGFVLVAAEVLSEWEFMEIPEYLVSQRRRGLFLIIYFVLVLTFGFTLLTSDIAIGRRTQKSAIGAYTEMHPKWKFLGILTVSGTGPYHDLLCCYRRMDHQICCSLPDWTGKSRCSR